MERFKRVLKGVQGRDASRRRAELARIHLLAKQLGLEDDVYREVLRRVAGVASAADLDAAGRRAVIAHFHGKLGGKPVHRAGAPRTIDDRPMLRKIEALLADAERPWRYAEAIAQRICHVDRLEFCSDADLRAVIAALVTDARRHPQGPTR